MIKIKDKGAFETVPPIVLAIVGGDIPVLKKYFTKSNIDDEIALDEYVSLSPLDIALIMNEALSIKWLVEQGADLNVKDNPSFLIAVRYCDQDFIKYLVGKGAKTDLLNNVKSDAFSQALHGDKLENLPVIDALGHSVRQYGGKAFRSAVSKRNYRATDFFIKHGVDIDYNRPDQVFPFNPTPLCVAARYVDLGMVEYLVGHGADATLAEKDGMRPYSIAVERGDQAMADYLKSQEPEEFHTLSNKRDELRRYKLPASLLTFLEGDDLRLGLGEDGDVRHIDFFRLLDVVEMKVDRRKLIRLSKEVDNHADIVVCWNPKAKRIAFYDAEHGAIANVASFDDFVKRPAFHMRKYFDGEYDA